MSEAMDKAWKAQSRQWMLTEQEPDNDEAWRAGWNARAAQAVSLPDRGDDLEEVIHEAMLSEAMLETRYPEDDDPVEVVVESYAADVIPKLAQAVLAALSTQPAAGEVEYRRVMPDGRPRLGVTFETMPELDEGWTAQQRTVGPWIEVPPSPAPDLFPGTVAALDHLSIRPEVQS